MKALSLLTLVSSAISGFNRCGIVSPDDPDLSELAARYRMPASATPQKMGKYTPKWGKIPHVPGLTQGGNTSAVIVYPSNSIGGETFPFLSFAHGTFVGGRIPPTEVTYKPLLELVASNGFVVVAPDTCSAKACYSKFSADQIATISACKANTSLHPGLAHATFEKVGVFGHSMGGMSTLACAGGSSCWTGAETFRCQFCSPQEMPTESAQMAAPKNSTNRSSTLARHSSTSRTQATPTPQTWGRTGRMWQWRCT
jgi:predicted dienelactone hydrolase